jgi:serine/threonine protein phosphatase 1
VIDRIPERLFAVGDLHGCIDELKVLVEYLERDLGLSDRDQVIFIGDYVDRGPAPNLVLEFLLDFRKRWPNTVFLRGNHEEMLLGFLGLGGSGAEVYLRNGGEQTLRSYGIDPEATAEDARRGIPASHLEFLQRLEWGVQLAEFLFVHAGVRPGIALDQQSREDCVWIRDDFLNAPHDFKRIVVFGHTPFYEPSFEMPYRIGIDTGVVYGNKLSMVDLVNGGLYQVRAGQAVVEYSEFAEREVPAEGAVAVDSVPGDDDGDPPKE